MTHPFVLPDRDAYPGIGAPVTLLEQTTLPDGGVRVRTFAAGGLDAARRVLASQALPRVESIPGLSPSLPSTGVRVERGTWVYSGGGALAVARSAGGHRVTITEATGATAAVARARAGFADAIWRRGSSGAATLLVQAVLLASAVAAYADTQRDVSLGGTAWMLLIGGLAGALVLAAADAVRAGVPPLHPLAFRRVGAVMTGGWPSVLAMIVIRLIDDRGDPEPLVVTGLVLAGVVLLVVVAGSALGRPAPVASGHAWEVDPSALEPGVTWLSSDGGQVRARISTGQLAGRQPLWSETTSELTLTRGPARLRAGTTATGHGAWIDGPGIAADLTAPDERRLHAAVADLVHALEYGDSDPGAALALLHARSRPVVRTGIPLGTALLACVAVAVGSAAGLGVDLFGSTAPPPARSFEWLNVWLVVGAAALTTVLAWVALAQFYVRQRREAAISGVPLNWSAVAIRACLTGMTAGWSMVPLLMAGSWGLEGAGPLLPAAILASPVNGVLLIGGLILLRYRRGR